MSRTELRMLACIAHHGTKNRRWLDEMLRAFSSMRHTVDVVILSEAPKQGFDSDIEVRVGVPTEDPWSLPFAHHEVFRERIDDYDLFFYGEDDTLLEERHVDAFVELNAKLPADLIPGFQRFEIDRNGQRSFCSVHSQYRWLPDSVCVHGGLTFARFTNDHGGCYLATREHLERAIAAGALNGVPYAGKYDMLVSAATDLYTGAGLRKVYCLERLEAQLVHHLPDVYVGQLGIDEATYAAQIDALRALRDGTIEPYELCRPEVSLPTDAWDRHAYPQPSTDLDGLLRAPTGRVLSIGMASGRVEEVFASSATEVVGIAMDPVLAAAARHRGFRVEAPECLTSGNGADLGTFDTMLCLDVLQFVDDPTALLRSAVSKLRKGGELIVTVPDSHRYELRNRLQRWRPAVPLPTDVQSHGMRPTTMGWLKRTIQDSGLSNIEVTRRWTSRWDPVGRGGAKHRLTGNTLVCRGMAS